MKKNKNIFLGKKILIYGLGKSGISSFKFLNNQAELYFFDDDRKKNIKSKPDQRLNNLKEISKINFDKIIISPGIDIKNCKLSRTLKKISQKYILTWMFFIHFIRIGVLLLRALMVSPLLQKFCMRLYWIKNMMQD